MTWDTDMMNESIYEECVEVVAVCMSIIHECHLHFSLSVLLNFSFSRPPPPKTLKSSEVLWMTNIVYSSARTFSTRDTLTGQYIH
jgi:hypothetical protein